jgi:DNA-binding MarR family transcriptional regulator
MTQRPPSLAEEIKQNRPFATSTEEALVSVLRAAAVIRRVLGQRIDPFGISPAQYNVLRILRGAGPDGLPTLAVRDRLVEEAPGITRLIDKLESAKLVRRDRTGKDRRTVRCHITPAGLELLERADEDVRSIHALVANGLPDEADRLKLVELLARLRAAVPPG